MYSLARHFWRRKTKKLTFSPNILMVFSMSAKFIPSTFLITGTTRPWGRSHKENLWTFTMSVTHWHTHTLGLPLVWPQPRWCRRSPCTQSLWLCHQWLGKEKGANMGTKIVRQSVTTVWFWGWHWKTTWHHCAACTESSQTKVRCQAVLCGEALTSIDNRLVIQSVGGCLHECRHEA